MARRQPTQEQREKAAQRREFFRELSRKVSAMSMEEREDLVNRLGAIVTVEGRPLSFHNTCLVLHQLPTASLVGGFAQWRDKGRKVCRGATGLMIWVPLARKGKEADSQPVNQDGTTADGSKPGFIPGYVFDVSQTEEIGEPAGEPTVDQPASEPELAACGSLFE